MQIPEAGTSLMWGQESRKAMQLAQGIVGDEVRDMTRGGPNSVGAPVDHTKNSGISSDRFLRMNERF